LRSRMLSNRFFGAEVRDLRCTWPAAGAVLRESRASRFELHSIQHGSGAELHTRYFVDKRASQVVRFAVSPDPARDFPYLCVSSCLIVLLHTV
jgi:hypothetical protein